MPRRRELVTIVIDEPTSAAADGQPVERPVELGRRWAQIETVAGRERWIAQSVQADVTHRVRLVSDPLTRTITARHWLRLADGTRLDVTRAYDARRRNREVELECVQRT